MEDIPVEQLYQDYQNLQTPKSVEALSHRLETWYRALCMSKLGGASYADAFEKACNDLSSSIGKISNTIQKPKGHLKTLYDMIWLMKASKLISTKVFASKQSFSS